MLSRIATEHCYRALLSRIHPPHDFRTATPQCHGRTDGRTDGDPHSLDATIFLFSDARAHIREMAVDKSDGETNGAVA